MCGLDEIYRQARKLGIESNIAELEAFGFTIVEPEKAAPKGLAERLLDATLSIAKSEDLSVVKLNRLAQGNRPAYGRQLFHLLLKDPVYLEGLMNPVVLTLAAYLMGVSCRLYASVAFIKEGKATPTHLHNDSSGMPPPLPALGNVCNASWLLTDYTVENGTFFLVPGSHRYCRHPTDLEQPKFMGGHLDDDMGVPVIGKPGSLLVFHGNMWHGTYPKTTDGVRVHVVNAFCRNYVNPAEDFGDVPEEMVLKGGPRFARLIGREEWQRYRTEGPDYMLMAKVRPAQQSPYG